MSDIHRINHVRKLVQALLDLCTTPQQESLVREFLLRNDDMPYSYWYDRFKVEWPDHFSDEWSKFDSFLDEAKNTEYYSLLIQCRQDLQDGEDVFLYAENQDGAPGNLYKIAKTPNDFCSYWEAGYRPLNEPTKLNQMLEESSKAIKEMSKSVPVIKAHEEHGRIWFETTYKKVDQ